MYINFGCLSVHLLRDRSASKPPLRPWEDKQGRTHVEEILQRRQRNMLSRKEFETAVKRWKVSSAREWQ